MTFSALLLAGGESRRMGRDKAAIEIGHRPLWQRQVELLRELNPEKIFVSARSRPAWLPDNVELLLDDAPPRGPLSGVTKGLTVMRTSHLIVLAVDMPFMTANGLRESVQLSAPERGVVPIVGGHAEPLAAVYPAEALTEFSTALGGLDFSLQSLVHKLIAAGKVTARHVPEQQAVCYRSLNAPDDLAELNA